ncbi:MAG: hypothetical protein K8R69_04595 [Deltaproteobacteria bacterium]|nr:hypothetical protein [Deltaproteobacteria bacterium]
MVHLDKTRLERVLAAETASLQFLKLEDANLRDHQGLASFFNDCFSEAEKKHARFKIEIEASEKVLNKAMQALTQEDLAKAYILLSQASHRLSWAFEDKLSYLHRTTQAGDSSQFTVVGLGVSAFVGYLHPGWGVALGASTLLHERLLRSETPPAPLLSSKRELDREAMEALHHWEKGQPLHKDPGSFLLRADASQDPTLDGERFLTAWEGIGKTLPNEQLANLPWQDQVQQIMYSLLSRQIRTYERGYARLSDFFLQDGGNCELQTLLLYCAQVKAKVMLPPGKQFGFQIMPRHIQLVIYDSESHKVWDLLNNVEEDRVRYDIYDPAVLFHAYLSGRKINPGISPERLLIAKAEFSGKNNTGDSKTGEVKTRGNPILFSNSYLDFPIARKTGGETGEEDEEEIPELANVENSYLRNTLHIARESDSDSQKPSSEEKKIYFLDEVPAGTRGKIQEQMDKHNLSFFLSLKGRLVFRAKEDALKFISLNSLQAKENFLLQLAGLSLTTLLRSPKGQKVLDFHHQPISTHWQVRDLDQAREIEESFKENIKQLENNLKAHVYPDKDSSSHGTPVAEKLASVSPIVGEFSKTLKEYKTKFEQSPAALLDVLDKLDTQTRPKLINFLFWWKGFDFNPLHQLIVSLGQSPTNKSNKKLQQQGIPQGTGKDQNALEASKGQAKTFTEKTPTSDPSQGFQFFEVELSEWVAPPQAPPQIEPAKEILSGKSKLKDETLIDLLLGTNWLSQNNMTTVTDLESGISTEVPNTIQEDSLKLWTPQLSKSFIKLNQGSYDDEIIQLAESGVLGLFLGAKHTISPQTFPFVRKYRMETTNLREDWIEILHNISKRNPGPRNSEF